MKTIN